MFFVGTLTWIELGWNQAPSRTTLYFLQQLFETCNSLIWYYVTLLFVTRKDFETTAFNCGISEAINPSFTSFESFYQSLSTTLDKQNSLFTSHTNVSPTLQLHLTSRGINRLSIANYVIVDVIDYSLAGHVISSTQVPSRIDCGFNCLDEQRCVSYNYEEGEKVFHDCELNSESKETRSSDLTERTNYSYYGLRKSVSDKFKIYPVCLLHRRN